MADKVEKPTQVTVEALKAHTNAGESYDVGDTYDVDEAAVDNLALQGMAARVDRVAVAKEQRRTAEKAEAARRSGKKTAVEPMTTTSETGRGLAGRTRAAKTPRIGRTRSKR